ncbi:MAG: HAD-IIB family hydrolase [Polyangiales bacterium]
MRPLAQMPAELARGVVGVAFDVDDTLTRHGRLERAAYDALWKLHDAGVRLIAVTGRPLGFAEVYARQWPVDVAVGENGAGWIRWEGDVRRAGFAADLSALDRQREVLERICARVAAEIPTLPLAADSWLRRCDRAWDVGESYTASADERARFVAICTEEGAKVTTSSVHTHAVPGDWDKASGIALALRDALGTELDVARWVFVGDSGNDAAAFACFDRTSVGVANLRVDELTHRPAYLASRSHGEGFAEVAELLLGARS